MIVAVGDFSTWARWRTKGLNIFNTKYVLASPPPPPTPTSPTSSAWSATVLPQLDGQPITCRDWFQLCLKEGLTVFRDQSSAWTWPAAQRAPSSASTTCACCASQFPGTPAPWRTGAPDVRRHRQFLHRHRLTKGAEVVRMMSDAGRRRFRQGHGPLLRRHDGVPTCDDSPGHRRRQPDGRLDAAAFKTLVCAGRHAARHRPRPLGRATRLDARAAQPAHPGPGGKSLRDPGGDGPCSTDRRSRCALEDEPARKPPRRWCWCSRRQRAFWHLRRRQAQAGAFAAAPLLGAGAAVRQPLGDRAAGAAGARQRPFSRWESRPAPGAHAASPAAAKDGHALHLDAAFVGAMRGVLRHGPRTSLQRAGADAATGPTSPGSSTMSTIRCACTRRAKAMVLQLARELRADWEWAWETHPGARRHRAATAAGGRARWLTGAGMLCLDAATRGDVIWQDKATSASRTPAT